MKNLFATIPYAAWFIMLLLLILFFFHPDAFSATHYTVIKGDTLSKIAQSHLGDWRKWKDLAEWNDLRVEWKKGIPYVLIRPGQSIRLESPWTKENIEIYRLATKHLLKKEIFRMIGISKVPTPKVRGKINLMIDTSSQYELREAQKRIRELLKDLPNKERLVMAEEIYDYSMKMPLHFFKDRPWIAERATAILLIAILTTESHGRFVQGRHGEYGPYQIKAETYRVAMGYKKKDIPDIIKGLMSSHYMGLQCAHKLLERGNSPYDALKRYNAGEDGKWRVYALKVLRSYYGIMKRGK